MSLTPSASIIQSGWKGMGERLSLAGSSWLAWNTHFSWFCLFQNQKYRSFEPRSASRGPIGALTIRRKFRGDWTAMVASSGTGTPRVLILARSVLHAIIFREFSFRWATISSFEASAESTQGAGGGCNPTRFRVHAHPDRALLSPRAEKACRNERRWSIDLV